MIRINLLPPEITEKRRSERRWVWVIFGAVIWYAVLFVFFGVMLLRVQVSAGDVTAKTQEAATIQRQADSLRIFEEQKSALDARRSVTLTALSGRQAWSRLMTELSLVLPTDMWLESVSVDEKSFHAQGTSVDHTGDVPLMGYKNIAKLLVRLTDLDQITNIWLTSSSKGKFLEQPVITFQIEAEVVPPSATTTGSVPAPPSQPQ
jgi:hypothetical protein